MARNFIKVQKYIFSHFFPSFYSFRTNAHKKRQVTDSFWEKKIRNDKPNDIYTAKKHRFAIVLSRTITHTTSERDVGALKQGHPPIQIKTIKTQQKYQRSLVFKTFLIVLFFHQPKTAPTPSA